MRISDWSSDVCSSDLRATPRPGTCDNCRRSTAAHDSRSAEFPSPTSRTSAARSRPAGRRVPGRLRLLSAFSCCLVALGGSGIALRCLRKISAELDFAYLQLVLWWESSRQDRKCLVKGKRVSFMFDLVCLSFI